MAKKPDGPLIPDRVMLVGEERIPGEVLENLPDEHLKIFLREPDPSKWPEEMGSMKEYLSREERTRWAVRSALAEHEELLGDTLRRWSVSVWRQVERQPLLKQEDPERIFREIANYLRNLIEKYVEQKPRG